MNLIHRPLLVIIYINKNKNLDYKNINNIKIK